MRNHLPYCIILDNDHFLPVNENDFETQNDSDKPSVSLFKLNDNEFQVIEMGNFRPILDGTGYLLIIDKIADVLQKYVGSQITINNVRIYRKSTDEEWFNYRSITIKNEINYTDYSYIKCNGLQIFHLMNTKIYISPDLKDKIETELVSIGGIRLKQGISLFIG